MCSPRKSIYLFVVLPSESIALHFLIMHDDISRQTILYSDVYKFITYPYNILQEFVIDNEVIVSVPLERFPPRIMRIMFNIYIYAH